MIHRAWLVGVALLAVCAVALGVAGRSLPPAELERAKAAALAGDGKGANAVSVHFGIDGKQKERDYWFRIAVENEDPYALQEYAAKLWMSGGERNCHRARFFTDKAIAAANALDDAIFKKLLSEQQTELGNDLQECVAKKCSVWVEGAYCDASIQ